MEVNIGDIIQYKYDDWSYKILNIDLKNVGGEVLYQCISPSGEVDVQPVWCHSIKDLIKYIKDGEIIIIHKEIKPTKRLNKLNFI